MTELLPGLVEKKRDYLSQVPNEPRNLVWEMQVQALTPLATAGKLGCFSSPIGDWCERLAIWRRM